MEVGILQSFLHIIHGWRSQEECIISICETWSNFLKEFGLSCILQPSINQEQVFNF